jgi:CRP/FNR family transcriptional regulator, cyclic AMP receptor protein
MKAMPATSPFKKFLRKYSRSEVIFEENTLGSEMYIIHSGKVKLTTTAPGHEVTLVILGPGEFFGEMALCDSEPRTATAVADDDNTHLVALDHDKFLYLVSQQPAFALTIMHGLCQRIRERWSLYEKMLKERPPEEPNTDNERKKKRKRQ